MRLSSTVFASISLVLTAGVVSAQCPRRATLTLIPDLTGGLVSVPVGVSPDGGTVVGSAASTAGSEAFLWTRGGGILGLGLPTDWFTDCCPDTTQFNSEAAAVSDGGSVVTGYVVETENGNLKAFRWTPGGGMENISGGPLGFNAGRAISRDGITLAGEWYPPERAATGFRWTTDGGFEDINPTSPLTQCLAFGMSYDGSAVAGSFSAFPSLAFRWTQASGIVTLGDVPGGPDESGANAISGDGTVVVGFGSDNANFQDKFQATRWSEATGMVGLGRVPGTRLSSAFGVNETGSVVVGNSFNSGDGRTARAFVWFESGGIQSLQAVLAARGAAIPANLTLVSASDVDAAGQTVVGTGLTSSLESRGYVATLGAACLAEYNADGQVDFFDYLDFAVDFSNEAECADVNSDGQVDFFDYLDFAQAFSMGSC